MVDSFQGKNVSVTNIKELIASLKQQAANSANTVCESKHSSQLGNVLITKEDSKPNINSELGHKCSTNKEPTITRHKLSINRANEYGSNQNTSNCRIWDILKTLKASRDVDTIQHKDNTAITTITTPFSNKNEVLENDICEQRKSKNDEVNNCKRLKLSYNQGNQSGLTNSYNAVNIDKHCDNINCSIKQLNQIRENFDTELSEDNPLKFPSWSKNENCSNLNNNEIKSDILLVLQSIKDERKDEQEESKIGLTSISTKRKINTLEISTNKFENKTTFDDFCTNVAKTINSKLDPTKNVQKMPTDIKINTPRLVNKEKYMFPKSCSTGYIEEKNINSKYELNSLPITDFEIKSRRERVEKKVNFDDFVHNIVREINNSGNNSINSKLLRGKSDINSFKNEGTPEQEIQNLIDHKSKIIKSKSREIIADNTVEYCENTVETNISVVEYITVDKNTDIESKLGSAVNNNQIDEESEDFLYFSNCTEQSEHKKSDNKFIEMAHPSTSLNDNMLESALSEQCQFCRSNEISSKNETTTETEESLQNSMHVHSSPLLQRDDQDSRNNEVGNRDQLLEDLIKNLTKQNKNVSNIEKCTETIHKKKYPIRRYKKGKMKIYKIKSLKKLKLKTEVENPVEENLNFNDLFKRITQNVIETERSPTISKSMSSISTPSSYITDFTKSEILSTGSNELTSPQQRLRKGINEISKDKSLLSREKEWEDFGDDNKDELKMRIQEICLKVGEDLLEKKRSSLKYRRQSFSNCVFKDGRLQLRPLGESAMTEIKSTASRSRIKFKLILYIIKKIQTLLETNTKLTKRELYYQLKAFVNDQGVIDRIINSISSLLNVGMWTLNIIAQKGLVFGNLKIMLSSGESINCNIPGTLIPQDINEIVEIHSLAYFILVVEKESIFYKLIEEGLPKRLTRPFIMITGKGFPDLNTQLFLKKLWTIMAIPVFILVDADPHGINIMLNYRFGSVNNAHVSHHLAVPNAKWLGVYPSEVINLNLTKEVLSERELKLVNHLLRTPYVEGNARIVAELKVFLEKKYKAEIEGLIKSDTFLSDVYLPNKFFTHNFI